MRRQEVSFPLAFRLLLDDGEECVCVQSISYSLLCRWFKVAVLPLDAALCAEITKGRDEIKRCAVCGAAFTPNSNRAKYCPDCAVQVRRKKEAERQRKRYLLSTFCLKCRILSISVSLRCTVRTAVPVLRPAFYTRF